MADARPDRRRYPISLVVTLVVLSALCFVNLLVSLNDIDAFGNARNQASGPVPRVAAKIAFVTGGVDPFWDMTVAGAREAAGRYHAELEVHTPEGGVAGQNRILQELLAEQVNGIAISPLDAVGQADLLTQVASTVDLITFDSDAPDSRRLCYVGTNNYLAGWQCGEILQHVLPDGGRVLISVGTLEKENGRIRRQGMIDKLLDRAYTPHRNVDAVDARLAGEKYTIVATIIDENDAAQARANVAAALNEYADVDCIVGLYSYSGASALAALSDTGKLGQIKVVAFDDNEATLEGIRAGNIAATIVQDAYHFGYASVEALVARARHEANLPIAGEILYPCFAVTRENLEAYTAKRIAQLERHED